MPRKNEYWRNPELHRLRTRIYAEKNREQVNSNRRGEKGKIYNVRRKVAKAKWFQENKERLLKKLKKDREANPEKYKNFWREFYLKNKKKCNLRTKKYYQKNKEKIYVISKKWRLENKERMTKIRKNWIKLNYKKYLNFNKIHGRKYRAKKSQIIHKFTKEEWQNKILKTNGVCPHCNVFFGTHKLHMDHIFPVSKAEIGRVYTIDDIQPLCKSCNSSKYNKVILNE